MPKTYVTFGSVHTHHINGKTFDKDCVAVINHSPEEDGREIAFNLFGREWCMEYPEKQWDAGMLRHFPRGYIEVLG